MGPLTVYWTNWEDGVTGAGDISRGILRVDQILDSNGNQAWHNGQDGKQITGIFDDMVVSSYGGGLPGSTISFTGGNAKLYLNDSMSFNPLYPGSGVTDGALFLSLDFVPGGNPFLQEETTHAVITGMGYHRGMPAIFAAQSGLADVTGGIGASMFDTNSVPRLDNKGFADMQMNSYLYIVNAGIEPFTHTKDGWDVWSFGMLEAMAADPTDSAAAPEPATMLMVGIGALALAARKLKKAA